MGQSVSNTGATMAFERSLRAVLETAGFAPAAIPQDHMTRNSQHINSAVDTLNIDVDYTDNVAGNMVGTGFSSPTTIPTATVFNKVRRQVPLNNSARVSVSMTPADLSRLSVADSSGLRDYSLFAQNVANSVLGAAHTIGTRQMRIAAANSSAAVFAEDIAAHTSTNNATTLDRANILALASLRRSRLLGDNVKLLIDNRLWAAFEAEELTRFGGAAASVNRYDASRAQALATVITKQGIEIFPNDYMPIFTNGRLGNTTTPLTTVVARRRGTDADVLELEFPATATTGMSNIRYGTKLLVTSAENSDLQIPITIVDAAEGATSLIDSTTSLPTSGMLINHTSAMQRVTFRIREYLNSKHFPIRGTSDTGQAVTLRGSQPAGGTSNQDGQDYYTAMYLVGNAIDIYERRQISITSDGIPNIMRGTGQVVPFGGSLTGSSVLRNFWASIGTAQSQGGTNPNQVVVDHIYGLDVPDISRLFVLHVKADAATFTDYGAYIPAFG